MRLLLLVRRLCASPEPASACNQPEPLPLFPWQMFARAPSKTLLRGCSGRLFSALAPSQQPTQMSVLENQMRVASETTGGETATVGVWIDSGSRHETDANNGVAHFLEHMLYTTTVLQRLILFFYSRHLSSRCLIHVGTRRLQ